MPPPRLDTPASTPPLELILGYGPAFVIAALAAAAWADIPHALEAARLWSAAILLFLAGVPRGLSFFTQGGERPSQIVALMLRFWLGFAALVTPPALAFALLVVGYASVGFYDPLAARHGTAPRFFARLRPRQMAIAGIALVALLLRASR